MFHKWFVAFWFLVVTILIAVAVSAAIFEREASVTYDIGQANLQEVIQLSVEKVKLQERAVQEFIFAANGDLNLVADEIIFWCEKVDEIFSENQPGPPGS